MKFLLIIFPLINALYTGSNINNAKDYPRIRPTKYNLTINRPLFHFTPSFGWMNDPNGCFYDKTAKVYHLYFQHNPQTTKWGLPLYWGHAISYDLNLGNNNQMLLDLLMENQVLILVQFSLTLLILLDYLKKILILNKELLQCGLMILLQIIIIMNING